MILGPPLSKKVMQLVAYLLLLEGTLCSALVAHTVPPVMWTMIDNMVSALVEGIFFLLQQK